MFRYLEHRGSGFPSKTSQTVTKLQLDLTSSGWLHLFNRADYTIVYVSGAISYLGTSKGATPRVRKPTNQGVPFILLRQKLHHIHPRSLLLFSVPACHTLHHWLLPWLPFPFFAVKHTLQWNAHVNHLSFYKCPNFNPAWIRESELSSPVDGWTYRANVWIFCSQLAASCSAPAPCPGGRQTPQWCPRGCWSPRTAPRTRCSASEPASRPRTWDARAQRLREKLPSRAKLWHRRESAWLSRPVGWTMAVPFGCKSWWSCWESLLLPHLDEISGLYLKTCSQRPCSLSRKPWVQSCACLGPHLALKCRVCSA